MSQPDLYWHCASCGEHEPAQAEYKHGDSEPCITCANGVARVMTMREAAALEQRVALGVSDDAAFHEMLEHQKSRK